MIQYCAVSLCDSIVGSPVRLILLQLIASIGLIFVSDWFSRVRAARRGSSIEELEALFALRDLRRRSRSLGRETRSEAPDMPHGPQSLPVKKSARQ